MIPKDVPLLLIVITSDATVGIGPPKVKSFMYPIVRTLD
jgi:hypothetical protein